MATFKCLFTVNAKIKKRKAAVAYLVDILQHSNLMQIEI